MSGAGSAVRALSPWRPSPAGAQPHPQSPGGALAWRLDAFNKFLLSASPVSRLTAAVGREACRTLGFSRAAFLHASFTVHRVRGGAGYGLDSSALGCVSEPFESSPWILSCAISGRPAFSLNVRHGPLLPMRYVELFGLGPLLCVPVIDSAGPVAVMLLDRRGDPFGVTDELLRAAASMGQSLGLALEAARSYGGQSTGREQLPVLSARQHQMLGLLSRGKSNKEIATATGLSVFTVRDHVSSLLHSLDVTSRSAAVARGWELGLLSSEQG
ncbi:MAG: LuxR C-terminal-related transcriptional regulator [Solirubrobacteraceae bacterium]